MKQIRLKLAKRPARILHGHPWVFAGEIETPPKIEDGVAAELLDTRGNSLGSGIWSGKSQIVWRRFSRVVREWDGEFLASALEKAVARRGNALPCCRLVWSEADSLPGLVVDKFEDTLVVQALTVGADRQLPFIADWLNEKLAPAEIIFRNDAPTRKFEGLENGISFIRKKYIHRVGSKSTDWNIFLIWRTDKKPGFTSTNGNSIRTSPNATLPGATCWTPVVIRADFQCSVPATGRKASSESTFRRRRLRLPARIVPATASGTRALKSRIFLIGSEIIAKNALI